MNLKKKIVFRLDDISWDMNYENFLKIRDIFIKHNICPLIGVIPCNKDEKLKSQVGSLKIQENEFWQEVSTLQNKYGWDVAIHGYDHVYITDSAGLLGINKRSEFAGASYEIQNDKIKKAQEVFKCHNIKSDIFMAPAHSFDWNTVLALKNNGIFLITDGQCEYPYCRKGVWFVPQVRPFISTKGSGYDTVCFHINKFKEEDFITVENFLEHNKECCVSFSNIVDDIKKHSRLKWLLGNMISKPKQFLKNLYRFKLRRILRRFYSER